MISALVVTITNQNLKSRQSEFTRIKDESLKSNEQSAENDGDGVLRRHEISQEDHPLSLGKASVWNQYFEVCLYSISRCVLSFSCQT